MLAESADEAVSSLSLIFNRFDSTDGRGDAEAAGAGASLGGDVGAGAARGAGGAGTSCIECGLGELSKSGRVDGGGVRAERGASSEKRGVVFSNNGSCHSKCGVCSPANITESRESTRPRGSVYLVYTYEDTAEEGSPSLVLELVVSSVPEGRTIGVGLLVRCMLLGWLNWLVCEFVAGSEVNEGPETERFVLDRLSGREKLKDGRGKCPRPVLDVSELRDGERGCGRAGKVDMGEYGRDTALPEDSFRGLEKVEPALELL